MTAVGLGQRFSSSRLRVRVSVVPNIFTIYLQHFSIPKINETLKNSPTKFFGTVRQKFLTENRDTPSPPLPPFLSIKFFDTRNFVKHRRVPLWSFSVLRSKKVSRENRDITLLKMKFFDTRNFLKHRRFPQLNDLVLWHKNNFDGKSRYPPPLLSLTFVDTRNFLKHRRVLLRNFSALSDKNFSTETRDTLLHKVQKSVVELMFVKTLWKLNSKQ